MDSKAIAHAVVEGGIYVGIGAVVAHTTHLLQPLGGALFGAVAFLSGKIISAGLDQFFGDSGVEKILKIASECFGGLLVALFTMLQIGYKIQYASAVTLGFWMLPLTYAATKIALPWIIQQVS